MQLFSWLFGNDAAGDNRSRGDSRQETGRKLDGAMPPAAAGAQLSSEDNQSEAEKALKRATTERQ